MRYFLTHVIETERAETSLPNDKYNEVFINSVLYKLRNSYIHKITHTDKYINFDAPIFRFVWNGFNFLNPISKGKIKVKSIGQSVYISYKLFFWEFFMYSLIFSIIPFMAIFPNALYRALALSFIWLVYIFSTLIATHAFENYLRKLTNDINSKIKHGKDTITY